MFKTRMKLATLAVAAAVSGGAMMVATSAHALNVSQNNIGEVLFFPYYSVKNGMDTVFTVTNTTDKTAVFKVRFREARNSREVRDFNVVLSPYDHWSAAVTASGTGALVRTFDKSCTSPTLPASATITGAKEIGFTDFLFTSASAGRVPASPGGIDGGGTDMERVQEGYFEVFLMGLSSRSTSNSDNTVEYNAKHVSGTPRDCSKVDQAFLNIPTNFAAFTAPADVLKGHVMYVNTTTGQSFDAEPTALESWNNSGSGSSIIFSPGDDAPNLINGSDSIANGLANGVAYSKDYAGTLPHPVVNAASAVLAATTVINEFASGTGTSTSWVVTFPTKHHYTDFPVTGLLGRAPFAETFHKGLSTTTPNFGKSCDSIAVTLYDREETSKQGTNFSPAGSGSTLCYEANVVDFNGSTIFGTAVNHLGLTTTDVGTAGWARIKFGSASSTPSFVAPASGAASLGLPVIGFSAQVRTSGGATVNYGGTTAHTYISGN